MAKAASCYNGLNRWIKSLGNTFEVNKFCITQSIPKCQENESNCGPVVCLFAEYVPYLMLLLLHFVCTLYSLVLLDRKSMLNLRYT